MGIPIFNRRATRNNIRSAALSMRSQQLALTEAQQNLRKEIEQAYYNADAAYGKYRASESALRSARLAFAYEEQKADAGRSTVFDYNDARTRMQKAESDPHSGQIRVRLPHEDSRFLPRNSHPALTGTAHSAVRRSSVQRRRPATTSAATVPRSEITGRNHGAKLREKITGAKQAERRMAAEAQSGRPACAQTAVRMRPGADDRKTPPDTPTARYRCDRQPIRRMPLGRD